MDYEENRPDDDYYYYYYYEPSGNSSDVAHLVSESYRKTLPVNIAWMVATALGTLAIVWAIFSAITNKRLLSAKEIPYIGFLVGNLCVLLVVQVPDIIVFCGGQSMHNEWSKFVYDIVSNLPLCNLVWIGLHSWIETKRQTRLGAKASLALGTSCWILCIGMALPFSFAYSQLVEDTDYLTKYKPLFLLSLFTQKIIPLAAATLLILMANINLMEQGQLVNCEEKRYETNLKVAKRRYGLSIAIVIIYCLVWIAQDIHIVIYLYQGTNLAGLELYHIAIYHAIETTAIFTATMLVLAGNTNFWRCFCCASQIKPLDSEDNASLANLLANAP